MGELSERARERARSVDPLKPSELLLELADRIDELEKFAADVHRLLGRGTHGNATSDFKCAISGLLDVLEASRENSAASARFEEERDALRADLDALIAALPPCRKCDARATYELYGVSRYGYACDRHPNSGYRAVEVPWAPLVRRLGEKP